MEIEIIPYDFEDKYLWKFVDIHKFLYFLFEKKLYFTRLDKFEDPNEGLSEKLIREIYRREIFPSVENLNPKLYPTESERKQAYDENLVEKVFLMNEVDDLQRMQFANCWFIGARESYAMWNLYSNPDSVVIRIKPNSLIDSIKQAVKTSTSNFIKKIVCGNVVYNTVYPPEYDLKKYERPTNKYSALKKDLSYEYENEYRFVAFSEKPSNEIECFEINLPDFNNLDFIIISHPRMQTWMINNINNILISNGMNNKLVKSEIKLKPSH